MALSWKPHAYVAALFVLSGCAGPAPGLDLEATNAGIRRAKAVTAAQAVLTTQLALRHLLAALAQAGPAGATPLAALGAPDPDATATYRVDAAAGTGRIDVVKAGQASVALDVAFTKTDVADGVRFDLTRVAGTVEGFALATNGTRVAFRQFPGEAGWGADVNLNLALTAAPDDARQATARLTLPAVPAAPGVVLGSLAVDVPAQEARFDGTIAAAAAGPVTEGGLAVAGRRAFDVRLDAAGAFAITPVDPDAPPDLPAMTP